MQQQTLSLVRANCLLSLIAVLVLSCCEGTALAQGKLPQHASPQAAFKAYDSAMLAKNWQGVLESMVPEDRDEWIGPVVRQAVAMKRVPEIQRLLDRHFFNQEAFDKLAQQKQQGRDANGRLPSQAPYAATIQDGIEFYVSMRSPPIGRDRSGARPDDDVPYHELPQPSEVDDLTITGNDAKGTIYTTSTGGLKEQPVAFRKIDGGWFVDVISEEEAKVKMP